MGIVVGWVPDADKPLAGNSGNQAIWKAAAGLNQWRERRNVHRHVSDSKHSGYRFSRVRIELDGMYRAAQVFILIDRSAWLGIQLHPLDPVRSCQQFFNSSKQLWKTSI